MHYKDMILEAKSKGLANEEKMWESIEEVGELLEELKESHPDKYWMFMRKTHGMLHNHHYDEKFAKWDVEQLQYTNEKGEHKHGEYWSVSQVDEMTKGLKFPSDATLWDKYVALNATYSDFCRNFNDEQIVDIMFLFYFADEDWGENYSTKVWDYFCCKAIR